MTSKLDTAGLVERRSDLLSIIRAAAINTARRPAGLRGPYVFDEAELQALAEALTQAAPDMELQRFTPKTTTVGRDALPIFMGMEPDPDGAWVHYTEARAALAHKGEGR